MLLWWKRAFSASFRRKKPRRWSEVVDAGEENFQAIKSRHSFSPSSSSISALSRSPSLLSRSLTLTDLVLLGIGASVGSGVFVVAGVAAKSAGPAVCLSFLLAAFAALLDALCFAEMSSTYPGRVGGAYLYTYFCLGELPAFLVFCQGMMDYHVGAATIAKGLAGYMKELLSNFSPNLFPSSPFLSLDLFLPPLVLLFLTALLCKGVRESSTVNGVLTSVKLLILLIVILVGACYISPSNYSPFFPPPPDSSSPPSLFSLLSPVLSNASFVFFSFIGFDAVANTAEESKNPKRDVPLGLLLSLLVCSLIYLSLSLVLTGMVPFSSIDIDSPLAHAFRDKGLLSLDGVISVGAIVGLTTTLLSGLYVQSRLYLALSRDHLLPSFLHLSVGEGERESERAEGSVDEREERTEGRGSYERSERVGEEVKDGAGTFSRFPPTSPSLSLSPQQSLLRCQLFVCAVAIFLVLSLDLSRLTHILSIGVLFSYSSVCASVLIEHCCAVKDESVEQERRTQSVLSFSSLSSPRAVSLSLILLSAHAFLFGLWMRKDEETFTSSNETQIRFDSAPPTNSFFPSAFANPPLPLLFLFSSLLFSSPVFLSYERNGKGEKVGGVENGRSREATGEAEVVTRQEAECTSPLLRPLPFPSSSHPRSCEDGESVGISGRSALTSPLSSSPAFLVPFSPFLPLLGLWLNFYLISQMHPAAWLRFLLVSLLSLLAYAGLRGREDRGLEREGGLEEVR